MKCASGSVAHRLSENTERPDERALRRSDGQPIGRIAFVLELEDVALLGKPTKFIQLN